MARVSWKTPDELAAERLAQWRESATVSKFQAKAALMQAGLLDQVVTVMEDPATDAVTKLAWQDAQEFRRDSPTVLSLAGVLGLTDEQLDDLFVQAAAIEA